uniref:Potassium channel domain-containing protein n=1 Tax=Panagrolaimus sp. PS1159 TaxID=55785 RepID=A0AC35FUE4_9BILA
MPMKHLKVPGESSSTSLVKDASDSNGAAVDESEAVPDLSNRRMSHMKTNLIKIQRSFRDQAHHVRHAIQHEARRVRKPPKWVEFAHTLYHDWGLKHACLILVLILYNFLGAAIFYYCEASHDENQEVIWKDNIQTNRSKFIQNIIPTMFNNTEYLFFLTGEQTKQVEERLNKELKQYEMQLGVKYKPDQKIKWDFWNAMLYAQTLCTTIGDAQLYTVTVFGRIFTMIYATFGIPLVLSVLDDMGKWKNL